MSEQYKYITKGYVLYNEKFNRYLDKNGIFTDRVNADIYGSIRLLQMVKKKRADKDDLVIKKVATIYMEEEIDEDN